MTVGVIIGPRPAAAASEAGNGITVTDGITGNAIQWSEWGTSGSQAKTTVHDVAITTSPPSQPAYETDTPTLVYDGTKFCVTSISLITADPAKALTLSYSTEALWTNLMGRFQLCPGVHPPPALNMLKPSALAAAFWQQNGRDLLQAPEPSIKPGYAITGNRAFLETGSPTSRTFTHGTPLGTLAIAAQGTFYVDWGDGTPRSGPFDTSGASYPNGTITHVWEDTGRYTVTVYEQWTATWSLGGQTGTLTGLQTTGTLPNFEVRQLESVRNR